MSLGAALSACAHGDPRVPWDTAQMAREIAGDLRRFERFDADFRQVEVLAWRSVEYQQKRPTPLDPIRSQRYHALLWVRVESRAAPPGWVLVEAGRGEDYPWERVVAYRELIAPLTHPRPGEDPDGTWHGFARYATPPTSAQACDFARVSFLDRSFRDPGPHTVVVGLRRNAWRRVTGADPVCDMDE